MARTTIFGPDAFTAADGTNVAVYDSTNYLEQDGSNGFVRIITNNAYGGSHSALSDVCLKLGTYTDEQWFECTLVGSFAGTDSDRVGGNLRNSGQTFGSRDMYRVSYCPFNSGVTVDKVVNDSPTAIGAVIADVFVTTDVLSAEAITNGANCDIKVYKNGVLIGTRTDTSSVLTGGRPGLFALKSEGLLLADNFSAGTITGGAAASNPPPPWHMGEIGMILVQ